MKSKREYFHSGVGNQKTPDIVVDLRRIDRKKVEQWTPDQKAGLIDFVSTCEQSFAAFKDELLGAAHISPHSNPPSTNL